MGIAIVFPGQGSQLAGIGLAWQNHPAWSIVDELEAAGGPGLGSLVVDAERSDLASTRSAQLSVLVASLLAWRGLAPTLDRDRIVGFAGHSLGQVTALVATGALSPADGIAFATARADASAAAQAAQPGGLLALLGANEDQALAACAAAPGRAWLANVNGAGQVVVGGDAEVLDGVALAAAEAGVRRTRRLTVDGAFHTPLMAPAAAAVASVLAQIQFHVPTKPIVTNHDAKPVSSAEGWPERLTEHLVRPVRWADSVDALVDLGATEFIEVGPGRVLSGLITRIVPDATMRSVATPADLAAVVG